MDFEYLYNVFLKEVEYACDAEDSKDPCHSQITVKKVIFISGPVTKGRWGVRPWPLIKNFF